MKIVQRPAPKPDEPQCIDPLENYYYYFLRNIWKIPVVALVGLGKFHRNRTGGGKNMKRQ